MGLGLSKWGRGGLALLGALIAASPARAVPPLPLDALCSAEVTTAEQNYGIPSGLLQSISILESGRYDSSRRATIAWPWTVMAEGEGRYLPTKAAAIAEVRRLKARGVQNIDVGCMQVNLRYHPTAFADLDDAFDPAANVAYAARFLSGLHEATGHWPTAASYYHSQTPSLAAAYREKLMRIWDKIGGEDETPRLASAQRIKPPPPVQHSPATTAVARAEQARRDARQKVEAGRAEESRIAEAYRVARVAEYQLRRARYQEARAGTLLVRR
ncbi:transglycosylase SLT domain-containing protein [Magnetospirillum molischianum]|uniref:Soluble lytic murein transglycosylase and related regulatory protein n=1 Tax=Magnetospirillum molischianum DSM 120 TaxID=1150626 RepID=H8FMN7_MAGML|nr:transglycosylase SLT domain-containing protein [Magnetospirillum molischianum]CCG39625.1 Soluble lytic murein transglycosylase and related regulatory protein [Magnetospirillum molischianum DSM 120]